jgi:hypothetical protein
MRPIKKNPSIRELRQFGALWVLAFTVIPLMVWHRTDAITTPLTIWGAAIIVAVLGLVFPQFMRLVYLGMSYLAFPIGWVVSHVLMALIYLLVVTPIGLVLKVLRHDPLERSLDRNRKSYWVRCRQPDASGRYFRQF